MMRQSGLAMVLAVLATSTASMTFAQQGAPPPEAPPETAPPSADKAEGDKAEGDKAEGDKAEGDKAEGDKAEGDKAEGDKAEGDKAAEPSEPAAPAAPTPPTPPAAPAAPAPPPPTAPPAAEPPAATAPAAATPMAPQADATAATAEAGPPGADKAKKENPRLPPRVPWRGSSIKWGHSVTTTALGIGRDNIGGDTEAYVQSYQILLNYFLIDEDAYRLTAYTAPNFSVEMTNSDITTTKHEPQFGDLPLTFQLGGTLYKPGSEGGDDSDVRSGSLLRTTGSARMTVTFPTSPTSQADGTYLTTSPRLSLTQLVPVLGIDSPVLKFVVLGGSFRWDHRFSKATTAVDDSLDYPRQTGTGETFLSDQLSFSPLALNTMSESGYIYFVEEFGGVELEAYGALTFAQAFYAPFEGSDCDVTILTGCVKAQSAPDKRDSQNSVGFSAGVTVYPMPEWGIELAYASEARQLGPDGQRRDLFYNPDAVFQANLLLSIDGIYEAITGPRRASSYIIAKRNDKRRRGRTDRLPAAAF